MPDRWEISAYPSASTLEVAYASELRRREDVQRDKGKCNAFSWGGERPWLHGPDKPGGRVFCYFDGNDAVIVWTHERLGQPTHRDILVTAQRERQRPRGPDALVAPLAPRARQGELTGVVATAYEVTSFQYESLRVT